MISESLASNKSIITILNKITLLSTNFKPTKLANIDVCLQKRNTDILSQVNYAVGPCCILQSTKLSEQCVRCINEESMTWYIIIYETPKTDDFSMFKAFI